MRIITGLEKARRVVDQAMETESEKRCLGERKALDCVCFACERAIHVDQMQQQ